MKVVVEVVVDVYDTVFYFLSHRISFLSYSMTVFVISNSHTISLLVPTGTSRSPIEDDNPVRICVATPS